MKALYIEDSPEDTFLLKEILKQSELNAELSTAPTLKEGLFSLCKTSFDVCLLDLSLPDTVGLEAVKEVRALDRDTAIVVITANSDESSALEALRMGAHDYLIKGEFDGRTLARSIRYSRERRRNEADLKAAIDQAKQAVEARARFVATMSHEVRTPLTGALLATSLIKKNPTPEKQEKYLGILDSCLASMMNAVNHVLDLAKIESGRAKFENRPFSLSDLSSQVVKTISAQASSKNLDLDLSIDNKIPDSLVGNSKALHLVLMNLMGNAVKFTSQGLVSLQISMVHQTQDFYQLRFEVKDTGVGIKPQFIKEVFEEFSQAHSSNSYKCEGSGLGLSISQRLVQGMGGELQVESQEGLGSLFSFEISLQAFQKNEKSTESESSL